MQGEAIKPPVLLVVRYSVHLGRWSHLSWSGFTAVPNSTLPTTHTHIFSRSHGRHVACGNEDEAEAARRSVRSFLLPRVWTRMVLVLFDKWVKWGDKFYIFLVPRNIHLLAGETEKTKLAEREPTLFCFVRIVHSKPSFRKTPRNLNATFLIREII